MERPAWVGSGQLGLRSWFPADRFIGACPIYVRNQAQLGRTSRPEQTSYLLGMDSECIRCMQSHSLNTLLWVVRLGSLSAAAEHLNVTQSAVTRRIQELERDLHVKLFQRTGRLMTPTAAAHAIVPKAERALGEIAAMRAAALGGATLRGKVRIGIAELIGLTWFDRLLLRLEHDFPNVTIEIQVDVASQLIEGLNRHKLDVAFLSGSASARATSCRRWKLRTCRSSSCPRARSGTTS
jgi:DNA-binding transcriptional LysR family regulator